MSSSPSAASSYLSVPSASRFSSGTSSPLFLNDRNRNTTDITSSNTSSNNNNIASSYSTIPASGTVSPNPTSSSRFEMPTTVQNYNRYSPIQLNVYIYIYVITLHYVYYPNVIEIS